MPALQIGATGADVKRLQAALNAAGFDVGLPDGDFGPATEAAVRAFQVARHLGVDGVAGVMTKAALGIIVGPGPDITGQVTVDKVMQMLPDTSRANVTANLPNVLAALKDRALGDRWMILMVLGTIYVETGQFAPIAEFISPYNTSPGGEPFDLYDDRTDLGNEGPPDGATFKGRGFVQVTGRANYAKYSIPGQDLVADPDLALNSVVASRIIATYMKDRETAIRVASAERNLADLRRLVNGGTNGLQEFSDAYGRGEPIFPAPQS
jgi:peptidoglycan L-alanyl-D-glutamate endopeptidase CwlK